MRYLKRELEKIPAGLVQASVLEKAKGIAAFHISKLIEEGKFRHFNPNKLKSFEERRSIVDLYEGLLGTVPEETLFLLVFIYWLHDIGFGKTDVNQNHGKAAVLMLQEWGIMELFDARFQAIISFAIENHNAAKLPDLLPDADELSVQKDIFARILRDLDKLGGFVNKFNNRISDAGAKQNEIEYYHSGGEMSVIAPNSILDDFKNFKPIARECVFNTGAPYESIILFYFAWFFDINYRETVAVLIDLKTSDKFLRYFKGCLTQYPQQYEIIEKAINKFFKVNGFSAGGGCATGANI